MGKIRSEVNFETRNGRCLSNRKEYYENGNLFREGHYSKGQENWSWNIPIGVVKTFHEDGVIKSEELYDDTGSLHGESKFYTIKGELQRIAIYVSGKFQEETILIDLNKKGPEKGP